MPPCVAEVLAGNHPSSGMYSIIMLMTNSVAEHGLLCSHAVIALAASLCGCSVCENMTMTSYYIWYILYMLSFDAASQHLC